MQRRRAAIVVAALIALAACAAAVAWGRTGGTSGPLLQMGASRAHVRPALTSGLGVARDRVRKIDLIERLSAPPQVVILGGSRALRLDPAYLQRRTGLTGFNAAVTEAQPEDAWAFVSLLHVRFPAARFRFVWVIHADECGRAALNPALFRSPALARFFPRSLAAAQTNQGAAPYGSDPAQLRRVFAPDGYVIRDGFDRLFPHPGRDAVAVRRQIRLALTTYAQTPTRPLPRSVFYFRKTLALMQSIAAAPPVIVSAPVDPRILAASAGRGWAVRQRFLLRMLAGLHDRYRFDFADLSHAASCACTARDFFDGIHLRPSGARKVIDAVLNRFPNAFGGAPAAAANPGT